MMRRRDNSDNIEKQTRIHKMVLWATAALAVNFRLFLALADQNTSVSGQSAAEQEGNYLEKVNDFETSIMPRYCELIDAYRKSNKPVESYKQIFELWNKYCTALSDKIEQEVEVYDQENSNSHDTTSFRGSILQQYEEKSETTISDKGKMLNIIEKYEKHYISLGEKQLAKVEEDSSLMNNLYIRRSQLAVLRSDGTEGESYKRTVAVSMLVYKAAEAYKKAVKKPQTEYEKANSSFKGWRNTTIVGAVATIGAGLAVGFRFKSNPIGWVVVGLMGFATICAAMRTKFKSNDAKEKRKSVEEVNEKYSKEMVDTIEKAERGYIQGINDIKAIDNNKENEKESAYRKRSPNCVNALKSSLDC
jgi:PHP family Zn ribbon phosphoesterase